MREEHHCGRIECDNCGRTARIDSLPDNEFLIPRAPEGWIIVQRATDEGEEVVGDYCSERCAKEASWAT